MIKLYHSYYLKATLILRKTYQILLKRSFVMKKEFVRVSHPEMNFNIRTICIDASSSSYLRKTHFHDNVEFIMVTHGDVICSIEGTVISLAEGQCILINQNIIHHIDIESETATFTYLQFNINDFLNNANSICTYNKDTIKYCTSDSYPELSVMFKDILNEYTNQPDNYEMYIHSCILKLIVCMSRLKFINIRNLSGTNADDIVYNTIKYLHENYNQPLTLDKIGKDLNISKFHLSRVFKNTTGSTIMEFLTAIRFSHIETLLIKTNKNISQIAYECGFPSIQHFNKVFKANKGLSPTQYRRYSQWILKM